MSQQEENGNPVPNETSADSPQNGAVLASYQRGGDVESKICYKLLVAALTFFSPALAIVLSDLYIKSNLAYYKIFDVELSYSFNTLIRKYLISGIVFVALIFCGVWVCQVINEYYLSWKHESDWKKCVGANRKYTGTNRSYRICKKVYESERKTCEENKFKNIKGYLTILLFAVWLKSQMALGKCVRKIKKCGGIGKLNEVCKKVWENEQKKLHEEKRLKVNKWLTRVFPFIFLFPISFFAQISSMASLNFNEYGINDLQIFGYVMMWLVFSLLLLAFFLWLMDDKKQKKYVLLWLFLPPFLFIVFSSFLRIDWRIDWKVFFTWETLWMFLVVILSGVIFLGLLSFFYKLEKDIWEKIEGKVAQWLKRDEVELKIVRSLSTVAFCTFGMLMFVLLVSQGVHGKGVYSVVYQSQESDGIIGISVYEDDTRMIVIPAREVQKGDSVSYEVIEEYGKDEKGQSIPIYSHRYMDKTGLFIKRVPNHQIDWKNRLNKQ